MPLSAVEVDVKKQASPTEGILPVVVKRWSPRSFLDKPVSSSNLTTVFEAARWAASSSNLQPWRFLVGLKGDPTYNKILATLVPFNQVWAGKAPVLIFGVAADKNHKGDPNVYALHDLGAASAQLAIQATALGLHAHSMGGFDHDAALKAFDIPAGFQAGAVIALGYQAEPSALDNEKLIAMEESSRERKPLSEIVLSSWSTPAKL